MLTLLKLLQSLVRTLHSEGTPAQIALGFALGAALGLTPILSAHNLLVLALLAVLNVSFAAGMLAWAVFVPIGFLLDPVFDRIGQRLLLETPALQPFWTRLDNTPVLALANLDNTVVVGSIAGWLLLTIPIFLAARAGVLSYRATLGERFRRSRLYTAVSASRAYNVYRWFRP
jgi:uncharacterized protein (TIGR03546 family)